MSTENEYDDKEKKALSGKEREFLFRYYEDQWTHVRHHETLRSSLTFQILVSATAIVGAYISVWNLKHYYFRLIMRFSLGIIMILLGLRGYSAVKKTEQAAKIHILRARRVREKLKVLEPLIYDKKSASSDKKSASSDKKSASVKEESASVKEENASVKEENAFPVLEPIYLSFNQIVVALGIILVLTSFFFNEDNDVKSLASFLIDLLHN